MGQSIVDVSDMAMISLNRILFFPLVSLSFLVNAQSLENLLADESKISHWQAASFVSEEGVRAFCD